jgi:hypothetical protein
MKAQLFCTLKHHVITEDGDFVPAGTPVDVICCGERERLGVYKPDGTPAADVVVECRARSYAFRAEFEPDRPAVCSGLFITVKPENLIYQGSRS